MTKRRMLIRGFAAILGLVNFLPLAALLYVDSLTATGEVRFCGSQWGYSLLAAEAVAFLMSGVALLLPPQRVACILAYVAALVALVAMVDNWISVGHLNDPYLEGWVIYALGIVLFVRLPYSSLPSKSTVPT